MSLNPETLLKNANDVSWNKSCEPKLAEWAAVAALVVTFWAFHAWTYNWYPSAWSDEVGYSEPGINLAQGRGFTTWASQFQPPGTFWAVNPPLYGLVLAPWVRMMGASLLAVRCFNFTLFAVAAWLAWAVAWRFKLMRRARERLAVVMLIELGYGISLSSRSARPDVLGLLALLLLLLAFGITGTRLRRAALLLLAMTLPWIGLHVALYAALASVIGWGIHRRVTRLDLVCVAGGMGAGALLLLGFLVRHDALANFKLSVHAVTQAGGLGRLGEAVGSYIKDPSCLPLIMALVYVLSSGSGILVPRTARIILSFALVYLAIPVVFCLSAHFRAYYSYMIYVPLVLAFGHAWSESRAQGDPGRRRVEGRVFAAAAIAAVLAGLPLRLLMTATFCEVTPRSELMNAVASRIHPGDVAYSDYFTFFESKRITPNVYVPFSAKGLCPIDAPGLELTQNERRRVNVLIVKPDQKDAVAGYFGGRWAAVGTPFGDSVSTAKIERVPVFNRQLQTLFYRAPTARFRVQVFRRIPGS